MILVEDLGRVPAALRPSAVTIGKFDGVHSGHRAVLDRLKAESAARGLASVVVTFDRNPLAVLRPELCPLNVVSVRQKLELLEEQAVDGTLLVRFDAEFAALSPEQFVTQVLVDALAAKVVLVGADFRFGARGAGDRALLERLGRDAGFAVAVVGDVEAAGGGRASSSRVRALLADGDVEGAAALLGRPPRMRGVVVPGLRRGRELGYPTANLEADAEGFPPGDGVYAGRLIDRSAGGAAYPAAISVGTNPTFDDVLRKQVEAYVLDRDLDLYGHIVEVEFVHRLRGMVAYEGIEPLKAQMALDVERTRELLAAR